MSKIWDPACDYERMFDDMLLAHYMPSPFKVSLDELACDPRVHRASLYSYEWELLPYAFFDINIQMDRSLESCELCAALAQSFSETET